MKDVPMWLCMICILCLHLFFSGGFACAAAPSDGAIGDGWTGMPAGARPAYMGIHGGTMPMSLLVYGGGVSLVSFVGRTGNDFLEVLRRTDTPVPSALNATARTAQIFDGAPPQGSDTVLMAGSGVASLPVIQLGSGLERLPLSSGQLQPFGFSDKPLSIEGQVTKPATQSPAKQYRLIFKQQYFQPRRVN